MGASVDHLQRHAKTGRLSFRKAFPSELRPHIPNQPVELKRSLGASNISDPNALGRFQTASAEYDAVVAKARKLATKSFDRVAAGYGLGYSAAKLAGTISRIEYPGLDLSGVRPWSSGDA